MSYNLSYWECVDFKIRSLSFFLLDIGVMNNVS